MKRALRVVLSAGVLIVIAVPASGAGRTAEADRPGSGSALGLTLDVGQVPRLPETRAPAEARRSPVRLVVPWSEIERARGVHDWSGVEPAVARIVERGLEPVVCLTGSNELYVRPGALPSPLIPGVIEAWTAFVRSAVAALGGRVRVFEIWDAPDRDDPRSGLPRFDPDVYAFVVKSSALALRAEAAARGVDILIAQGSVDPGALDWQRRIWAADGAAYIDILPLAVDGDAAPGEIARKVNATLVEAVDHPPAPVLWAYVREVPGSRAGRALGAAAEALSASASAALVRPAGSGAGIDESLRWVLGMHAALSEGFAPAPLGDVRLEDERGAALEGGEIRGRFFSEADFTTLVVCDLARTRLGPGDGARLVLDLAGARDARVLDPVEGDRPRTASSEVAGRSAVRVPVRPYPVGVLFRRPVAAPGFELPPEELEIARTRGLTAQEILARHQEVQKRQDDRVDRFIARGRVDLHFRLAGAGASVDVGIESNYFWEKGGELEWEETDYFINGNRAPWKKFPELPLIQPEKVITLPLDLTLDRTYTYRLEGEDRVNGRPAYILGFRPADPDASGSLYRGRVWIDRETFVRLKTSLVQTNLEAPVIANEERDTYAPMTGPDGEVYWLLSEVDGQQLWTAGGRNFVVQREVRFTSVEINPDEDAFRSRRSGAYGSSHVMLRETREGFRYLERQPDGTRQVKDQVDSSQLFAAAGVFKDESIDTVTPLAGVNWFNYDLGGRNIQANVFFAGVFLFANATKPGLFGRNADAAAEVQLFALSRNDEVFVDGEEVLEQRVDFKNQNVSVRLGVPFGTFYKLTAVADVDFNTYFQDEEARKARRPQALGFVLPADHQVLTGSVQLEFNRTGYTLIAWGSWSRRSDWRPWGVVDAAGDFVDPEFDPAHESYARWQASLSKEWFLPKFQKIRGEVAYLDGSDLDRFSRYRFSSFGGTRLAGFSGSGVRFDRGAIVRARYAFNVFDVIQLGASLETARTENDLEGSARQSFTGAGLSGNFVGPWKTVISFSYGRALSSDIADLEGDQQYLLSVFKLF